MMDKTRRTKIYSLYEINVINFYATMVWLLPMILVVTYVFEIDQKLDINRFIFWTAITNLILVLIGTAVLLLKRDAWKRQVKPNYQTEFVYLLFICSFGILGLVVFYDYMHGDRQYIANILIIVASILVYFLIKLGRKFFKFDYMKKK